MNGIVLGVAMLVSSAGASPVPATARATLVSPAVFSFDLPDPEPSHRVWRRQTFQSSQPRKARKSRLAARLIAVAAGVCVGWFGGGALGYKLTENRSNPYDDMSGLPGAIVGAIFGSTAGGTLGWVLTDR